VILTDLAVDPGALREHTGWELKPEGLCRADVCIPVPGHARDPLRADVLAEHLDAPLVHDEAHGLWALGPAAGRRALGSARLPEIVLPDLLTGEAFDLRTLRGTRVLLIAWASW